MRWFFSFLVLLALLFGLPLDALAAYAQTTPVRYDFSVGGRRCSVFVYGETDVSSSTDAVITLPAWQTGNAQLASIVAYKATKGAGDAATLHTVFGYTAAFSTSTQAHIATATATAAHIHEQGETVFWAPQGRLYIRPVPNAGTNNVVSTEITICEGRP